MGAKKRNNSKSNVIGIRVTDSEKRKIEKANIDKHDLIKLGLKYYYKNKKKAELKIEVESLNSEIKELTGEKEFIDFKINKKIEIKEKILFKLDKIKTNESDNFLDMDSDEAKAIKIIHNAFERKKDIYNDITIFLNDLSNKEFLISQTTSCDLTFDELIILAQKTYV